MEELYNRNIEFDLMKGIGILLVVIGHLQIPWNLHLLIYGFHMPLFFFVSGCFAKKREWAIFCEKNFKKIVVPYLLFSFTLLVVSMFLSLVGGEGLNKGVYFNFFDEHCFIAFKTIWFLICLLWVRVIHNMLLYINHVGLLSCFLLIIGYVLHVLNINIPCFVDTTFSVLIFYHLGFITYQHVHKTNMLKGKYTMFFLCFFVILYVGVVLFFSPTVDFKMNVYPWYIIFVSLLGIASLYLFCTVIQVWNKNLMVRTINFCGKNSLYILGFSSPCIIVLNILASKTTINSFLVSCIEFFIVVPLSLLIGRTIERIAPVLVGKDKVIINS